MNFYFVIVQVVGCGWASTSEVAWDHSWRSISMASDNQWGVQVEIRGKPTRITFTPEALTVFCPESVAQRRFRDVIHALGWCLTLGSVRERQPFRVPLRNVIWAELGDNAHLTVAVLSPAKRNSQLILYEGPVTSDKAQAQEWVHRLMKLAYDGDLQIFNSHNPRS
jgi:hypothetical protein